jgi:transposase
MAEKDIIRMSIREVKRLKVIQEAIERHITQRVAASMIGLSERQTRRLVRAVREEGEEGVIHRLRGRFSNRRILAEVKAKVLMLYRGRYTGFGPTLATEKLGELDGIKLSDETLRKWLMEAGLWQRRRKRSRHRQWRQRKECFGEMVQLDGSHHDWLEGRGPELVLMAYIDDATNHVFARFYDYEGTIPAMDSFKRYARRYGLPLSIYLDRHSTYLKTQNTCKSTKKLTEWEEFERIEPLSQFERALKELGVDVIHAYSPQAKGRVERLFGVLQDRLVKEMRLRGIKTKESANEFLADYLPQFNRRFRVCPANDTNVHVRVPKYFNLDKYLCIKTERTVRNDNTITHNGRLYQIGKVVKTKKVIVEERLNGSLHIMGKGTSLRYREIAEKPVKIEQAIDLRRFHRPPKPAENHPWRRSLNWNPVAKKEDTCILTK